ncbi:MAG: NADH-quinone oxidoreductase, subunit J [Candidatus Omnitrophica bacterium CG11_big_fil_rev_8_21_14_0_20_64_10]|nr:MAG: NADH-quinone oxidoreductase, subunit J [Candidatus Omnitrophica bacterium CG11_big_fil_rev_8_21_14_0_20_64_10]
MIHPALFYSFSALTLLGALGAVAARHPMRAVLSLTVSLFGLSGLFVGLGAHFVAVIQILLYAGAILILFLFVVMLVESPETERMNIRNIWVKLLGIGFGAVLLRILWRVIGAGGEPPIAPHAVEGTVEAVGRELLTTYALPFEAASILLLVGIVGAIVLAKRKVT